MKEDTSVTIISSSESLQAITNSEIMQQIATAHQYPRDLGKCLNRVETIATSSEETAADCFYALQRGGKRIEGPSVRLAEIIATSWSNLRVASRVISNDGKNITAQGICHDLETNVAISSEVQVRITDSKGQTYNEDMQNVVGNAARAKAMRNAVFKVVPMALFSGLMGKIKDVAVGSATDLATTRSKMIEYYGKLGVDSSMLFEFLEVGKIEEIDSDMVVLLRGLSTALKEGTTTIDESIVNVIKERRAAKVAEKTKLENESIIDKAIKKSEKKEA